MAQTQLKPEQVALKKQPELNLSLEAQVVLAFKHKTSNRYRLLDKLIRAYIHPDANISDKSKYLSEKSKKLLVAILKKIFNGKNILLNHKYISKATRCKSDQNAKILKELKNILDIKYWDVFTNENGQNFLRHYTFEISAAIVKELKDTGVLHSEFHPDFNRGIYNNKNISNEIKIRSRANFSNVKNSKSETSNTELEEKTKLLAKETSVTPHANQLTTETVKTFDKPEFVETTSPKAATVIQLQSKSIRPANKRKTKTREELKQRKTCHVIRNGFLGGGKRLRDIQPYLTDEICEKLRSGSGRDFTNKAIREITKAIAASERGRQAFFYHINGVVAYLTPAFAREKRDPNKTGSESYYTLAGMTVEDKLLHQQEKYLNETENSAIHARCDYTQLRARIAGQFPIHLAYALLINMIDVKREENVLKLTMHKPVPLSDHYVQLLLNHANGIGGYVGVNELEFVGIVSKPNPAPPVGQGFHEKPKKQVYLPARSDLTYPEELQLPKGKWGNVCAAFISSYENGEAIYNHWLAGLSVLEEANTICLKTSSEMVRDRIEQTYLPFLSKVCKKNGVIEVTII